MSVSNDVWQGYARKNGSKGIRNKVLVIYTVECSSFVAKEITRAFPGGDVECVGFAGCTDNEYAIRLLIALIRHPNVGGVLAVGLGCEYTQPERLAKIAADEGKEHDWFFIQDEGGTSRGIERGVKAVERMITALEAAPRVPMTAAELVIGAECGGSDYSSGLAGNVVVGRLFDKLVDAGGTAVFEEILEAVGLEDFLAARAVDECAEKQLRSTYKKAMEYCKDVRQYSVSPGNFAGGLTTIEEKSMGALIKSGSRPIEGVLKVSQKPPRGGLWLLDTTPDPHWMQFGISNPNDNEGLTALASCGCHLLFLVTGRGNVVGNAVAPVIKVTGNSATFARMRDDMDFDAGPVLSGKETIDGAAARLGALVAATAGGLAVKAEILGHTEYCIPYKYQEKGIKDVECRKSVLA